MTISGLVSQNQLINNLGGVGPDGIIMGYKGTVTLTGSNVTVRNANYIVGDVIQFGILRPSGTVGQTPYVVSGVTGEYFVVAGSVGDSSTYTYNGFKAASEGISGNFTGSNLSATLDLTASLPDGVTITRSTTGTYYNVGGLLVTAAINEPRFDHNPSTLEPRGILRENEATNICLRSQELKTSPWIGTSLITANTDVAPDGTTTADRITFTSDWHVALRDNTGAAFIGTQIAYTPTAEWQRISMTGTAPAGCVSLRAYPYRNTDGTNVFYQDFTVTPLQTYTFSFFVKTADSPGTALWGCQMETGEHASSYIPTTTTSVTRGADYITSTLPIEMRSIGSMSADFELQAIPSTGDLKIVQMDSGADTASTRVALGVRYDNYAQMFGATDDIGDNVIVANQAYTLTGSWGGEKIYTKLDSGIIELWNDSVATSYTMLHIGSNAAGAGIDGWISSITLSQDNVLEINGTELTNVPSQFSWFQNKLYVMADGTGFSDINFGKAKPTGGITYYISPTGSSSADGLTPATPLNTLQAALAKPTPGEIVWMPGTYSRSRIPSSNTTLNQDLAMRVYNGGSVTILGSDQDVVWTQDGTYPQVYTRNRSAVVQVRDASDIAANGAWSELTLLGSVAAVAAQPGSYYIDGSNNVYVQTFDSRAPDNDLHLFLSNANFTFVTKYKLWRQGTFNLYGVQSTEVRNISATEYPTVYDRDIKAYYKAGNGEGYRVLGGDSYIFNVDASYNAADGIDYTGLNGRENHAFEWGGIGTYNGTTGLSNNNASTMHDGGSVIRMNSVGSNCEGPTFADVDTGTSSLQINVQASDTTKISLPVINYEVNATGWLINCTSQGAVTYDMRVGGTVRYFGDQTFTATVTSGSLTKVNSLSEIFS